MSYCKYKANQFYFLPKSTRKYLSFLKGQISFLAGFKVCIVNFMFQYLVCFVLKEDTVHCTLQQWGSCCSDDGSKRASAKRKLKRRMKRNLE